MAPIRIAMLSGPRNISTTMMRSFENRDDCIVADEPFYACYLNASGAKHPLREETLAAQSSDWKTVADELNARDGADYSFEKHISFHFAYAHDFDWLKDARVFHLIRDPRAMVASYKNKLDDVSPIIDSYRIQRRLYEQRPAPVIDAADVLKAPEKTLRALCAALGMPFSEKMLSWPAGPRASDGPWAPHWYDAVNASTGFKPYKAHALRLSPEMESIARACETDYAFFYSRTLVA
ncbi:HAD family hydrolase [Hyphococcus sp.]|uniref:sulfotransferase-like domain-containing protein n=1 Tax=Hyphococcus sp. TaxID=2038636 RepID=UPI003D14546C